MRLETADGQHVAHVEPMPPSEPGPVVLWGARVFHQCSTSPPGVEDTWQEITTPTVVREVRP